MRFLKWLIGIFQPQSTPKPLPTSETLDYGPDPLQKLDVYRPPNTMPTDRKRVLVLVHGGGWIDGDMDNAGVASAVACWVPRDYIVVSVGYRLYPQVTPPQEAQDVAAALASVQKLPGCGECFLIGHSAGAHLVALVTASVDINKGCAPWRGTACLDSRAYDVPAAIAAAQKSKNPALIELYKPFGTDIEAQKKASPIDQLSGPTVPMLLCTSNEGGGFNKKAAQSFADLAMHLGTPPIKVLGFDLDHGDMGATIGVPPLSDAIDAFLRENA